MRPTVLLTRTLVAGRTPAPWSFLQVNALEPRPTFDPLRRKNDHGAHGSPGVEAPTGSFGTPIDPRSSACGCGSCFGCPCRTRNGRRGCDEHEIAWRAPSLRGSGCGAVRDQLRLRAPERA